MKDNLLRNMFSAAVPADCPYERREDNKAALNAVAHDLVDDVAPSQIPGYKPEIRADNAHWLSTASVRDPYLKPRG